jgi:hypothetical protein
MEIATTASPSRHGEAPSTTLQLVNAYDAEAISPCYLLADFIEFLPIIFPFFPLRGMFSSYIAVSVQ